MRLQITHVLRYQLDGAPALDAVARDLADTGASGRLFVPGALPCGECPACRRGLVAVCPALRRWADELAAAVGAELELPDRFLTPLDDLPELPALASESALLAGPVALAQQALALAGAAPGDVSVWLGADPLARLGVRVAAARGLRAHLLDTGDPAVLAEALAAGETAGAAGTGPSGSHGPTRSQRHLVLTRSTAERLAQACALAVAGGTITALGPGPLHMPGPLQLPGDVRLLRTGAYHPDLVPESLALLRRDSELGVKLSAVSAQRSEPEPEPEPRSS